MNLLTLEQGSVPWLQARIGKCTGSRVKDALSFLKDGKTSSAKRKNYITDLVTERLTGLAVDHYITPAMEWGIENEPYARAAYSVVSGNEVDLVGICAHPTIPNFQSSPDGLVGEDGVVEFKCPQTTTHIEWMFDGIIPEEHEYQLLSHLACSGRQWVDFMSFDPRLPPKHQYFLRRMNRVDVAERITKMETDIVQFLSEVDEMIVKLEAR